MQLALKLFTMYMPIIITFKEIHMKSQQKYSRYGKVTAKKITLLKKDVKSKLADNYDLGCKTFLFSLLKTFSVINSIPT